VRLARAGPQREREHAGLIPIITESRSSKQTRDCRVLCPAAFIPPRASIWPFDQRTRRQLASSVTLPSAHSTKVFNCRPAGAEPAATIWTGLGSLAAPQNLHHTVPTHTAP
jgi:hypothetical protein